jgi:hypothetical protein
MQLDGETFNFAFHWNERESSFYVDISDVDNVPIISDRKIVADWPLLARVVDERRPLGEIYCVDLVGTGEPPSLDELNKRIVLLYFDAAEMLNYREQRVLPEIILV